MLIYMLLIFEGSLRKWVLPELSHYIFFIRDPFLIYAYFLATRHRLWPRHRVFLGITLFMAVVGIVIGAIQIVLSGMDQTTLMLAAYGWRNYFLYVPLAFLIGAQFRFEDLVRICRRTLLLSVPIGVLVAIQFASPINSPINIGIAKDTTFQFRGLAIEGEHTRPMGTFSSGAGQIQFVASAFAILLAFIIMPGRNRPISRWLLLFASGGLMACLAFSGSRATVLHCALIGLISMGLSVIGRNPTLKLRAFALPMILGIALISTIPILFPTGFEAFINRWQNADQFESKSFQGGVFGRALYGLVDFTRLLEDTPLLGYGLGIGGNASTTLGIKIGGVMPLILAETDWARHIVDLGPIFGSGYIVFRIALTIWLGILVLRATRRGAGPLPLLLFAYAGYVVFIAQITGQGAINAYAWLFTGFCIAAANEQFRRLQRSGAHGIATPSSGMSKRPLTKPQTAAQNE